jgi:hypothetical protein
LRCVFDCKFLLPRVRPPRFVTIRFIVPHIIGPVGRTVHYGEALLPVWVLVAVGGFFSLEPLRALEEDLHFAVRCPALGLEVLLVRAGQADPLAEELRLGVDRGPAAHGRGLLPDQVHARGGEELAGVVAVGDAKGEGLAAVEAHAGAAAIGEGRALFLFLRMAAPADAAIMCRVQFTGTVVAFPTVPALVRAVGKYKRNMCHR